MKEILLSGSSGALGSVISSKLKENNFKVTDINLRHPSNIISELSYPENSFFIHLASNNSKMNIDNIVDEVSILNNAIDIAKKNKVAHFVFFSTSKLYPASNDESEVNEDSKIFTNDPYTIGKHKCEELTKVNLRYFESITILRLAPVLVRSPSSNMNMLFKICEIMPFIPFFSRGDENQRSFLSMHNLINFILLLLTVNCKGLRIYNLCDQAPISTNDLIESFLQKYRPNANKFYLPKFIEPAILNFPVIGKKLRSMYENNLLSNKKLKTDFTSLKLLDTKINMELNGLQE